MRILLLYNRIPWPLHDGGALAVHSMALGLKEAGHEVHIFCLNPSRNHVDVQDLPADFTRQFKFESHQVDTHLRPSKALLNLLDGRSYHISRFYRAHIAEALAAMLRQNKFDIIQLEAPFVGMYLPVVRAHSLAKVVLRAHNVDHLIWWRLAQGEKQPLKAWYLKLQSRRLQNFETQLARQVDGIVAISEIDAAWYQQNSTVAVTVIPTGIDARNYRSLQADDLNLFQLHFLGSLDWQPNQEAVRWLANELWPVMQAQSPQSNCHLAGKNGPIWLEQLQIEGLHWHGRVKSAHDFMRQYPICLIPMRSGSGIRIKLLEALALGLPVITTSLGAEGVSVTHEKEVLFAEDAAGFAQALEKLQKDVDFAFELGRRGRAFVEKHYDRQTLTCELSNFYHSISA
jgi:glycosyltransferase involved in cell wall biosynthesis